MFRQLTAQAPYQKEVLYGIHQVRAKESIFFDGSEHICFENEGLKPRMILTLIEATTSPMLWLGFTTKLKIQARSNTYLELLGSINLNSGKK